MTTTPTASPELPDLDKLEALARAANPGPWKWWTSNSVLRLSAADGIDGGVLQAYSHRGHADICCGESDRAFIAAANPAAALALIAAYRAQPEGEAPQAEPVRVRYVCPDSECEWSWEGEMLMPLCSCCKTEMVVTPAATLSPLCGAQQAESGAPAALEQAAALVVKMTAPPRDLMGAPTLAMKATANLGQRIATAIRALTPVAAQSQGAQATDLTQLTKERDGWKEESEHQKTLCESARRSCEMLRDHERADYWIWQADGSDNLASMAASKVVLIRADQLRALAALTHEEGLSFGRRRRESMAEEIAELRAQQAAAPGALDLQRMRSAFHTNMLRAYPDKSHEEIAAEIDKAVGAAPSAPGTPEAPSDPVVEANRQLLLDRSRVGLVKYGKPLEATSLSHAELTQHALEEALDLANYLQAILRKQGAAQLDGGQGEGQ